jgi:hypothetical protein
MKVIGINPFEKSLQTFDLDVEGAKLVPLLMSFACWLNGTDALYAVEQRIVQQYFRITGEGLFEIVFGVGMVVGHDRNGNILEEQILSEKDIAGIVTYGSAGSPFRKHEGYHPWEE